MKKRNIIYVVEIGRGKGSYRTVRVSSTLSRALLLYNGFNIGNGYKKRLRVTWESRIHRFSSAALQPYWEWQSDSITLLTYRS